MGTPVKRVATYDDLFSVPDNLIGEIIAEELVTQPMPAPENARATSAIGAMLFSKFDFKSTDDPTGWWIFDKPECHLASDIVVPDIVGWKKQTMPDLPETTWFDIPPDWVCEVLSTSTAKYDRGAKRDIYAREGIGHLWIVDPIARMIEVFSLENGLWNLCMTVTDDQLVPLPPFDDLPFDLSVLWA